MKEIIRYTDYKQFKIYAQDHQCRPPFPEARASSSPRIRRIRPKP